MSLGDRRVTWMSWFSETLTFVSGWPATVAAEPMTFVSPSGRVVTFVSLFPGTVAAEPMTCVSLWPATVNSSKAEITLPWLEMEFSEHVSDSYSTLKVYKQVSNAYELDTRVSNLTWSYYERVAARDDRLYWLQQAVEHGWS